MKEPSSSSGLWPLGIKAEIDVELRSISMVDASDWLTRLSWHQQPMKNQWVEPRVTKNEGNRFQVTKPADHRRHHHRHTRKPLLQYVGTRWWIKTNQLLISSLVQLRRLDCGGSAPNGRRSHQLSSSSAARAPTDQTCGAQSDLNYANKSINRV